jgi:hypothetical protein
MNTFGGTGWANRFRSRTQVGVAAPGLESRASGIAVLLCGLVMAVALLSFFVQALVEHVERAELRRQALHPYATTIDSDGQRQVADAARQHLVLTAAR